MTGVQTCALPICIMPKIKNLLDKINFDKISFVKINDENYDSYNKILFLWINATLFFAAYVSFNKTFFNILILIAGLIILGFLSYMFISNDYKLSLKAITKNYSKFQKTLLYYGLTLYYMFILISFFYSKGIAEINDFFIYALIIGLTVVPLGIIIYGIYTFFSGIKNKLRSKHE